MTALIRPSTELDLFVQWQPMAFRKSAFFTGVDNATGTVRVMGAGVWREDDAQLYFEQQLRIVEVARRRFGALKVFFDVRDWVVESPQSALQFQDMNAEIYSPEDRLASVVSFSIAKQHTRCALSSGNHESFLSMNAAETWLQAYSARLRA